VNRSIATVVVAVAGVRQRERAHERKPLQRSAVVNNALALRVTRYALLQSSAFVIIHICSFKVKVKVEEGVRDRSNAQQEIFCPAGR
jgi:hypothetical protein